MEGCNQARMAGGRLIHQQPASSQTNHSGKLGKKTGKPGKDMGHSYLPKGQEGTLVKDKDPPVWKVLLLESQEIKIYLHRW